MAEIQILLAETQAYVEIKVQEEFVTQEPTSSQLNIEAAKG